MNDDNAMITMNINIDGHSFGVSCTWEDAYLLTRILMESDRVGDFDITNHHFID